MPPSVELPPVLSGQLDVLMIDNFDSFTWNLYQQLELLGANVTVIRNDAVTPEQFPLLKLNSLIISPGPGHPQTDSGVSRAAIEYFRGKVPVMGVCMGLECLVDSHGGKIGYAGEIMHGKVSRIRHDDRGCFKNIPQGILSTRYHSLSAALKTLPDDLYVTSITEESGVIMGVRHRKYTLEAVQYHPESILSEGGDALMRNFLSLRGGTWEENPHSGVLDSSLPPFRVEALPREYASNAEIAAKAPSILEKISAQRQADVTVAQSTPGTTFTDLERLLSLDMAPSLIPFIPRLEQQTSVDRPALIAEIKRASPSKGPISLATSPPEQALTYAVAGAQVISVLTEPKWFKGSLNDMLHVRQSIANLPNRPAILRKDFILSRYQVLESRIWGADAILLIVGMLPEPLLKDLFNYSLELGMEPIVEVNSAREMDVALSLPAKVVGINNRNLHDFDVDMGTTSKLSGMVRGKDVVLCAFSGINTPEDVRRCTSEGVRAVLVGESLMRAADPSAFIRTLLSEPVSTSSKPQWQANPPLVKICGIRTKDEALAVAEAGADMIGLMFVESSKRHIGIETAKEISAAVRTLRHSKTSSQPPSDDENAPWFTTHASRLSAATSRPLLVGVFQNAPVSSILHAISYAQLDMVQLHGSESIDLARQIPVPVIRTFHVGNGTGIDGIRRPGVHQFILLDSLRSDGLSGGSGSTVDWDLAKSVVDAGEIGASVGASRFPLPIILAGGLTPSNVSTAISQVRPWAVDVSGGVETADGKAKDLGRVRLFIEKAKSVH